MQQQRTGWRGERQRSSESLSGAENCKFHYFFIHNSSKENVKKTEKGKAFDDACEGSQTK